MQLVYSNQPLPTTVTKSIFLAGPSPRSTDIHDWRHDALAKLTELGYDGTVLIPVPDYRFVAGELDDGSHGWSYDDQIDWEARGRKMADIILFWIPRVIDRTREDLGMPGFTTNFELGEDLHSGKLSYGRPDSAVKCRYMDDRAEGIGEAVHTTLDTLLPEVLARLGNGAVREGGEAQVPLHIWRSEAFQGWYANLKLAGNRLDGADVLNCVMVGPTRQHLFTFTMKVVVWVASEQRHKCNEVILARKDVSAVFAFCKKDAAVHVALVREFRSTVNNSAGFVFELPGGSSHKPGEDPRVCAQEELSEELGLHIADASRFQEVGIRQLAATFSVHRASVYAIELTPDEFGVIEEAAASGTVFGAGDSEQTYAVPTTLAQLPTLPVDYSTLGMVYAAAQQLQLLA